MLNMHYHMKIHLENPTLTVESQPHAPTQLHTMCVRIMYTNITLLLKSFIMIGVYI